MIIHSMICAQLIIPYLPIYQVHLSPPLYWLFVHLIQKWGVVCKPFKDIVTGLRYLSILRSVLIDKLKYKVYQKSNQVQSISKHDLESILFQFFLAFELMLNTNVGLRNSSFKIIPVAKASGRFQMRMTLYSSLKTKKELVISAVW